MIRFCRIVINDEDAEGLVTRGTSKLDGSGEITSTATATAAAIAAAKEQAHRGGGAQPPSQTESGVRAIGSCDRGPMITSA